MPLQGVQGQANDRLPRTLVGTRLKNGWRTGLAHQVHGVVTDRRRRTARQSLCSAAWQRSAAPCTSARMQSSATGVSEHTSALQAAGTKQRIRTAVTGAEQATRHATSRVVTQRVTTPGSVRTVQSTATAPSSAREQIGLTSHTEAGASAYRNHPKCSTQSRLR